MATEKPHEAVSSAEQAVHSTTEKVARASHEAIERARDYGARAEEQLRERTRRASELTREYADEVGEYVNRRPVTALAIAFGAGILLGVLAGGRDRPGRAAAQPRDVGGAAPEGARAGAPASLATLAATIGRSARDVVAHVAEIAALESRLAGT